MRFCEKSARHISKIDLNSPCVFTKNLRAKFQNWILMPRAFLGKICVLNYKEVALTLLDFLTQTWRNHRKFKVKALSNSCDVKHRFSRFLRNGKGNIQTWRNPLVQRSK